jgi:hypothetical protein
VKQEGNFIIFTLKDGSKFTLPVAAALTYTDNHGNTHTGGAIELSAGVEYNLNYQVNLGNYSVEILSATDVEYYNLDEGNHNLTIKGMANGKVIILYYDANQTITSVITFK